MNSDTPLPVFSKITLESVTRLTDESRSLLVAKAILNGERKSEMVGGRRLANQISDGSIDATKPHHRVRSDAQTRSFNTDKSFSTKCHTHLTVWASF